jgi:hypothetical protein
VGANFAIDMCVGSLVVFAWHKMNSVEAELLPAGAGRRFRFHLRRRDLDLPVLVALSCRGEASELHFFENVRISLSRIKEFC